MYPPSGLTRSTYIEGLALSSGTTLTLEVKRTVMNTFSPAFTANCNE